MTTLYLAAGAVSPGCGSSESPDDHAGHDHGDHAGHDHGDHAGGEHAGHDHGDHAGHDHGDQAEDHGDHAGHDHGDHADHGDGPSVHLSATASANLGIEITELHTEAWYDEVKIPGTLREEFDRRAVVTAPSQVRVAKLDVPPHATVKAGQRLALLDLVDSQLTQTQLDAVEARAEWLKASTELERTRIYLDGLQDTALADERTRVTGDAKVLEAEVQASRSALDAALAALKIAGLNSSQLKVLEEEGTVATRIQVHAPSLDGKPELEIADRPVDLGETVDAGAILFDLVALDRLLVVGEAFEAELPVVRKASEEGLPVSLYFPAENLTVRGLSIRSIEGVLDGDNRVTHFFVSVPNEPVSVKEEGSVRFVDWQYRVGSRVQVLVATEDKGPRFLLPSTAIVREEGHCFVYRKQGEEYEQIEVRIESEQGHYVVVPVDAGLKEKDQIVSVGSNQIHLSANPSAADDSGHGHSH